MALAGIALELMVTAPLLAIIVLTLVLSLLFTPRLPAVLIGLAASIVLGWLLQVPGLVVDAFAVRGFMPLTLPSLADFKQAAAQLV